MSLKLPFELLPQLLTGTSLLHGVISLTKLWSGTIGAQPPIRTFWKYVFRTFEVNARFVPRLRNS